MSDLITQGLGDNSLITQGLGGEAASLGAWTALALSIVGNRQFADDGQILPTAGEALLDVGDLVCVSVLFYDLTGALVDPTSVTIKLRDPSGTIVPYIAPDVVKLSTGNYQLEKQVLISGRWDVRAEGDGSVIGAREDFFRVAESVFE